LKLKLILLVFREGVSQGELDVLCEFPDAITAIRAVAQLGAANSILFAHPDVKALLKGVGPKALARIHETLGEGAVVQIKDVAEHREQMPEELQNHPHAYHLIVSRPVRQVPPEGIFEVVRDEPIH